MIVGTGANGTTSKQPIILEQTLTAEFTNSTIFIEEFRQCATYHLHLDKDIQTINETAAILDSYILTRKKTFNCFDNKQLTSQYLIQLLKHNQGPTLTISLVKILIPVKKEKIALKILFRENQICDYCKKSNHIISDCRVFKRKRAEGRSFHPHAFAAKQ